MLRTGWQILWRFLAFAVAFGLLLAPVQLWLASGRAAGQPLTLSEQFAGDASVLAALLLATLAFTRLFEGQPLAAVGLSGARAGRDLLAGMALGAAWLGAALGALWLGGALAVPAAPVVPAGAPLGAALAGMLINAAVQELLVRGYPWRLVEQRAGPVAALLATSVLFAALHAGAIGHWLPALNLLLAGLAFGAARWCSGGLALPIGLHAAWNALLGPVLGLVVSGQTPYQTGARLLEAGAPALWGGGAFGVEGGLATTVVTAGLIWWLLRRPRAAAMEGGRGPRACGGSREDGYPT